MLSVRTVPLALALSFAAGVYAQTPGVAEKSNMELVGSNDLGEMALATPALVGDRLILRTENHLYSVRNKPNNERR